MKQNYRIYTSYLCVLCMSVSLFSHNDSEPILEQLMHVWSLVNIARSIAQKDSFLLNDQLFDAHLHLYALLYCTLQHQQLSSLQISSIDHALQGLVISHNELCNAQKKEHSFYLNRLMAAVRTLWKTKCSKSPTNEYIP